MKSAFSCNFDTCGQAELSGKYGSWTGPGHDLEAGSKALSPTKTCQ